MGNKDFLSRKESEDAINFWKARIKEIHKIATGLDYDKNIRYDGTLDFIISKSFGIKENTRLAAHFLYNIASEQIFFDGNKRTALLSALVVLSEGVMKEKKPFLKEIFEILLKNYKKNDVFHGMDQHEKRLVEFMQEVADRKRTFEEVLNFIDKQIIKRSDL